MIFDSQDENTDWTGVEVRCMSGETLSGVVYADTDARVLRVIPLRRVNYLPVYGFKIVDKRSGDVIAATHTEDEWSARCEDSEPVRVGVRFDADDPYSHFFFDGEFVWAESGDRILYVRFADTLTGELVVLETHTSQATGRSWPVWEEGSDVPKEVRVSGAKFKFVWPRPAGKVIAETAA